MKVEFPFALPCSSRTLADRGNDLSTAGIAVGNPADTAKGNNFSNGPSDSEDTASKSE